MRQRLAFFPAASLLLLAVALSCGGQASTNGAGSGGSSGDRGTGGVGALGGSGSGGADGGSATGGQGGDDTCNSLQAEARDRFYDELWKDRRTCETDDDCMQFRGHHNCISNCFILSNTETDGIEDALDDACAPFDEQGCEAPRIPCLVHTVACNESGVCSASLD